MKVKELKNYLEKFPDGMEIMTFSHDSFYPISIYEVYLGRYTTREGFVGDNGPIVTKYSRANGPDDKMALLLGKKIGKYLSVWPNFDKKYL